MTDIATLEVQINGKRAAAEAALLDKSLRGVGASAAASEISTNRLRKGLGNTTSTMIANSKAAGNLNGRFRTLLRSLKSLSIAVLGFAGVVFSIGGIAIATADAAKFSIALAEVDTLINTAFGSIKKLGKATADFAREFGTTRVEQAKALYQAISAGAVNATAAIELLRVANLLARGGVTDVETAVDGLTSVLNAFNLEVRDAIDVSDTFFIGIKAGKTTAEELSRSVALVSPVAAAASINVQDLVGGIAALTTQGIKTRVAAAGLRQTIVSIIRPTADTQKVVDRLGLEFNTTALATQGFGKFFQNLVKDIEGGLGPGEDLIGVMARLFPNVESLIPALSFAGGAGRVFNDIQSQMADRLGATTDASDKLAASLGERLKVATQSIRQQFEVGVGEPFLEGLVPVLESIDRNLGDIAKAAKIVVQVFGFLIASKVSAFGVRRVVKFKTEIAALGVAAKVLPGALKAIPLALALAFGSLQSIRAFGKSLKDGSSDTITFKDNLEDYFEVGIRGFKNLTSEASLFRDVLGYIGDALRNHPYIRFAEFLGGKGLSAGLAGLRFVGNATGLTDDVAALRESRTAESRARVRFQVSGGRDSARQNLIEDARGRGEPISSRAGGNGFRRRGLGEADARLRATEAQLRGEEQRKAEIAAVALAEATAENDRQNLRAALSQAKYIQTIKDALQPERAARDAIVAQTEAIRNSLPPGRERTELLQELGRRYANLRPQVEQVNEELEKAITPTQRYKDSLKDLAEEVGNAFVSAFKSAGDAIADFVLEGKSLLESFGDIVKQVIRQLISLAAQRYLIAPIIGGLGFADGGVINRGNVIPFANGGVVNSPTYFQTNRGPAVAGEAGAEAILPLARGSGGKLGVRSSGGGNTLNFANNVSINIEGDSGGGGSEFQAQAIAQAIRTTTEETFYKLTERESRPGGIFNRG